VIPREYPNLRCRCIDIEAPGPGVGEEEAAAGRLVAELNAGHAEPLIALRGERRWTPAVKPVRVDGGGLDRRLKEKGVYLVTGGLGGIGFSIALYLARQFQARLILTGRSMFPQPREWNRWVAEHGEHDPVSRNIEKARLLQTAGAEVLVFSADCPDIKQMRGAVNRGRERFGAIDGIIHCAGLPDFAGVIQRRTRETSEAVLAAKVRGTLVLDQLFSEEDMKLDPGFLALCSSLSSVLAPFGQVGYCAANAFLDSYAFYRTARLGKYTVSINWDAWQEVGMAVDAVNRLAGTGAGALLGIQPPAAAPVKPDVTGDRQVAHPLFHHWRQDAAAPRVFCYVSYLGSANHWVLDEHRIMGTPTLPGTAYLEMVRAAAAHRAALEHKALGRVEIGGVSFLSPITVPDGQEMEIHTLLEEDGEGYKFVIRGAGPGQNGETGPREYAAGHVVWIGERDGQQPPKSLDIAALEAACSKGERQVGDGVDSLIRPGIVTPGPRWNNLRRIRLGERQAMAWLELPREFRADLEDFPLHPAVLDSATSLLVGASSGDDAYLPFSYGRIVIYKPLTPQITVHARAGEGTKKNANSLVFDVTLAGENGQVLVDVKDYTLVKVNKNVQATAPVPAGAQDYLKDALTPDEGVEAFRRILTLDLPQVLVSVSDFAQRARESGRLNADAAQAAGTAAAAGQDLSAAHPRPDLSTPYEPPDTHTRQIVAAIWQELLGIGGIGIHDDFFELGGDSLKALTINARIHKELNVEVPVAEFFNSPTVAGLAGYIDNAGKSGFAAIEPVEEKEFYPLSSAQKRLYVLCRMNPDSIFYNLPHIMELEGALDAERLEYALDALIKRHESLRTAFQVIDEENVQVVHTGVAFKMGRYSLEDLEPDRAEAEKRRLVREFVRPFDLARAPLLRAAVIVLEQGKYIWMTDVHHIVADATALAIIQKDLFALYGDQNLAPLELQYKDFSTWQDRLTGSGYMKEHEDYWLGVYPDAASIPRLKLPTDFPGPAVRRYEGDVVMFVLDAEKTGAFNRLASSIRATFFMNVLAVMNVLLFKYSSQNDIIIGTTIAGRPHNDLQGIVGMFVNMLAIRNFPAGELTYLEFLEAVKGNVLGAFAHQQVQFETLVERLGMEKTSARNPLFEVAINVQNYEQPTTKIEGLNVLPHEVEFKVAKFDLLLWANEIGDQVLFNLEYSTELFKPGTAQLFSRHLQEILDQVIENPGTKLKDINLSHSLAKTQTDIGQVEFDF
jgi:NAD(P)-dependent dehydrogenase (short-subunit alcohol dehydrogenase family)/acyl carrier protein